MYSVSFGILMVQVAMADAFGFTMTNFEGVEFKSTILEMINVDTINTSSLNIVNTNQTTVTTDPIVGAALIAWELFLLLTGTYVFNIIFLFVGGGATGLVVAGSLVLLYILLLARAIIAYLRGI